MWRNSPSWSLTDGNADNERPIDVLLPRDICLHSQDQFTYCKSWHFIFVFKSSIFIHSWKEQAKFFTDQNNIILKKKSVHYVLFMQQTLVYLILEMIIPPERLSPDSDLSVVSAKHLPDTQA